MSWHPVTRNAPCLICNKSNNGYCMVSDKGEFLCMRVESDRPITLKNGEVGWVHRTNGVTVEIPKHQRAEPAINVGKLMERWHAETENSMVESLADQLGVQQMALKRIECAWAREHRAWAFPMSDGYGNYVGIRLRANNGQKWAVRGSHQGVFLPACDPGRMALVCEGPTDTAAALSLGFWAVGRPSCSGGMADTITALRRVGVVSALIVADADEVGARGAEMLRQNLPIRSALIVLPAKDLREFVRLGGTRELLDSMIDNLVWQIP